jgi:hypothetical protein
MSKRPEKVTYINKIIFLLECNFSKKESIEIYVEKVDKTA